VCVAEVYAYEGAVDYRIPCPSGRYVSSLSICGAYTMTIAGAVALYVLVMWLVLGLVGANGDDEDPSMR
jgi:hypothetical protein